MQSTKLGTTARWAVIGAVVGIGFAGVNFAVGQATAHRAPTVDGWRATGSYNAQDWPRMKFELTIQNVQNATRETSVTVRLERQEFKGNPASRVSRPGDIVNKELETQSFKLTLGGNQSKTVTILFRAVPDQTGPPKPSFGMPMVTYVMSAIFDGKPRAFAMAVPEPTR